MIEHSGRRRRYRDAGPNQEVNRRGALQWKERFMKILSIGPRIGEESVIIYLSLMESSSKGGWIGPKVALSDSRGGLGGYCLDAATGT